MQYTKLGRTDMRVSVAGLGCGGFSRLGLARGASHAQAVGLIGRALDAGVNLIDTAASYGTEAVVGDALRSRRRDEIVISTKAAIAREGQLLKPEDVVASLHASLRKLGTDYVDLFHLHGVQAHQLPHVRQEIVPALLEQRALGRLRALGITEVPPRDAGHAMLAEAVEDECFEVVMVACHMLHQSATRRVFPRTRSLGIGVLGMFAVRRIFSDPARLEQAFATLRASGELTGSAASPQALEFLVHAHGARSLVDAAYRFCRHVSGIDVVLFGTGVRAHLDEAIASTNAPPLPDEDVATLQRLFGHLRGAGLDAPTPAP